MEDADWTPKLVRHTFWEKKEQFLYENDTYITWVMFAVEEGSFEFQIGESYGQAGGGDIVFCPPHVTFHRSTLSPLTFHAITFTFREEAPAFLDNLPSRKASPPDQTRLAQNFALLKRADQQLHFTLRNHALKQHYVVDLWLMIMNELGLLEHDLSDFIVDELMRDVSVYLKNNAHRSLEMREVAARFDLTPVQLIRRFHSQYRVNPLRYLTAIRIKKACTLLVATDWKLDAIAASCGYENGFYLSRVFTRHVGVSPSVFRQKNRF